MTRLSRRRVLDLIHTCALGEDALLMAARAEVAGLAGEGKQEVEG